MKNRPKEYYREQSARWYREIKTKDPTKYNARLNKLKAYHSASKEASKAFLKELKSNSSCIKCGENNPACLVFHHRNKEDKKYEVSKLARKGRVEWVKLEIKKCDVLCANCHMKLHAEEGYKQEEKIVDTNQMELFT